MTDLARRPTVGLLLVSPAAAVVLALSTTWALDHPLPSATATQRSDPAPGASDLRLRQDLRAAAAELQRSQVSVLRLEAAVRGRADRMRTLEAGLSATGGHARFRAGSTSGAVGSQTPVQVMPLVPTPAAPAVNARTGAS